jgi:hypothetical protein
MTTQKAKGLTDIGLPTPRHSSCTYTLRKSSLKDFSSLNYLETIKSTLPKTYTHFTILFMLLLDRKKGTTIFLGSLTRRTE